MKRKQKIMTLAAAGLLTGLAIYGICQLQNRQNHITLEFGMFTGSNWDVAQAKSCPTDFSDCRVAFTTK